MSILVNLLPDTRQAKLRDHRRRQLIGGVSVLVWVVCGAIVALMTVYELGQKAFIEAHSRSIRENTAVLEAVPDLLTALTAHQHAESLTGLYGKRVYMTKFFQAYAASNPNEVKLSSLTVDGQNALVVNGTGRTFASVAKLARALEASNISVGQGAAPANQPYFTSVTITNVASSGQGVNFTISANLASGVTSGSSN